MLRSPTICFVVFIRLNSFCLLRFVMIILLFLIKYVIRYVCEKERRKLN